MKNSVNSILHKEIKLLFSLTYWMTIDPYTGKVYDSLQPEAFFESKGKVGVIDVANPDTDFKQVLQELPLLHYN